MKVCNLTASWKLAHVLVVLVICNIWLASSHFGHKILNTHADVSCSL